MFITSILHGVYQNCKCRGEFDFVSNRGTQSIQLGPPQQCWGILCTSDFSRNPQIVKSGFLRNSALPMRSRSQPPVCIKNFRWTVPAAVMLHILVPKRLRFGYPFLLSLSDGVAMLDLIIFGPSVSQTDCCCYSNSWFVSRCFPLCPLVWVWLRWRGLAFGLVGFALGWLRVWLGLVWVGLGFGRVWFGLALGLIWIGFGFGLASVGLAFGLVGFDVRWL